MTNDDDTMSYPSMIPLPEVFELHELPPEFVGLINMAPFFKNPNMLAEAQRIASELLAQHERASQGLSIGDTGNASVRGMMS